MVRVIYFQKFWKLAQKNFWMTTRKMSLVASLIDNARNIYQYSVQSVQPGELIQRAVQVQSNKINVQGKEFLIDKNVHIVGFGKAVLGMAITLGNLLQDHLVSGIISIPAGIANEDLREQLKPSRIKIYEGAHNNIPDSDSLLAANEIVKLVTTLGKSSLLFVLISGGGSALLPSPRFPLTLEEKQQVIKILASKGATIEELNIVRKKLSFLKGGGLAQLAKPAKVVSLILSDIIGDPISLIASGPTVENTDDPSLPISIVEKYKIRDVLPTSAVKLLEIMETDTNLKREKFEFVTNYIIGSNTVALNAAAEKAINIGYKPIIMTNKLSGLANDTGKKIIHLVNAALLQQNDMVTHISEEMNIEKEKSIMLLSETKELKSSMSICLLFGGETTVEVKGKGIGGRNQELALAASLELCKRQLNSVVMLSAGTDGIDGPTDAAGAIATPFIVDIAKKKGIDAENFLYDNNSYNFYNSLDDGLWHVKIGHTGTNVMDIIIVLIKKD